MRRGRSQEPLVRVRGGLLAALAALVLLAAGAAQPAFAVDDRVACRTVPGPAGRAQPGLNRGPCRTPDAVDYFQDGPGGRTLVVTNFGILLPGTRRSSWQLVCDDNFGVAPPGQLRLHPDGRIFAASNEGLFFSTDACTWSKAVVEDGDMIKDRWIFFDVAFQPQNPQVIFGLGEIPRRLWRSTDGGQNFTVYHRFADPMSFHRVVFAPSDGQRVYLIGRGKIPSTPFGRSSDGGQTFEFGDLASSAPTPLSNWVDFVAVAPDDPSLLYFYVINASEGDEVWKSTDGGVTLTRVLRLAVGEAFSGLAFGATPQTLYVAGTNPFPLLGEPPANLYVSRDAGKTWEKPITSPPAGPRYRCLTWSAGKLYACGAGEPGGDEFLVGVSSDDGKTWSPTVRLGELSGAKSCVQALCYPTEEWLCENYCYCAPGLTPSTGSCSGAGDGGAGTRSDTSTDARPASAGDACVGTACSERQGCSCRLGPASSPPVGAGGLLVLGLGLALAVRTRWRHVRR